MHSKRSSFARNSAAILFEIAAKKTLVRGLASDEAVNLKAKSLVASTRSGGRQIQQLSRHE
jgi:hypothetical protein